MGAANEKLSANQRYTISGRFVTLEPVPRVLAAVLVLIPGLAAAADQEVLEVRERVQHLIETGDDPAAR